jgi:hypothetical protein
MVDDEPECSELMNIGHSLVSTLDQNLTWRCKHPTLRAPSKTQPRADNLGARLINEGTESVRGIADLQRRHRNSLSALSDGALIQCRHAYSRLTQSFDTT